MRAWLVLAVPLGLVLSFADQDRPRGPRPRPAPSGPLVAAVDSALAASWREAGLEPAGEVDDLTFARRLWLDLLGTIPSLEEIRALEALPPERRRAAAIARALDDPRFDAVLAERLARIAVGTNAKPDDLTYRRRRLIAWLTAQVARRRPWDELVRELIAAEGLSTDRPATNFVVSQDVDPVRLAARTSRAFLGVRIDCAQCHDHPFARWKQPDFEGLAAFFARTKRDGAGVRERRRGELELDGPDGAKRVVAPAVPFAPELLPQDAARGRNRRAALAAWLTHPDNPFFARAIVNRLWHWLTGRGLVEPVDELDQSAPRNRALLELLAADLVEHRFDLRRTIEAIVASRAYALPSTPPAGLAAWEAEDAGVARPLKPLRADQLASALVQTGSLWTYDEGRSPLLRLARFGAINEFVKRHRDDLEAEDPEPETLLQRLHLLNGKTVRQLTKTDDIFSPVTRLPLLTASDEQAVEAAFLITLTRRPTPEERDHFVARLAAAEGGKARAAAMADLVWALLNCTELAWSR